MKEIFLLTFSFEEGFTCIDEAIQEIKETILQTLVEPITWVKPNWSTYLQHALECYDVTTEEGNENPWHINIPELEGQREVRGPSVEILDISQPVRTKQVNIGSKQKPKFVNICDYWDEDTVDKVAELLHEYQDLFPTKFSDLKGIVGDLGVMKINLKPDVKPVKQCPYQLNPTYKEKV